MGKGENTELLDLKMKTTESSSHPYKRSMFMAPSSHPHFFPSSGKDTGVVDGGPGDFVGSDIYDAMSSRALQPFNTSARGSMGVLGKAPFTAAQLQEFQRQTIICKYIMASMPVPPQLLLPLPNNPAHIPQSNTSGLDLKFSSGSDPEPWRCKRTDGKKWRCSRDVAPDQKYCERHAHKSKPRSRKPVEIHTTNNNSNRNHPPTPKSNNHQHSFQFPTVQLSSDQNRCFEWLGRGDRSGTIPVVTCNNQQNLQQLMQSSSGVGFNIDHTDQNRRNSPAFQVQDEAKVYPMNFNQYLSSSCGQILGSQLKNEQCNDWVIASLQGRGTTRDLFDGWSKDGLNDGISNNGSFTSLTLSMAGWNRGMENDNEHTPLSIGSSDDVLRSQWLNPVSWMSSTAPGGPLGEALCLGNATNLPSPHGYSNSTANSSCNSFGSCENGSHGLDFIG
ncbi:growth-regulating factor 8-like isoform X1 [Lycium ferocissimum]|uniref:growth-regulating factor 8-like isoform X1 n=1 Tax=Lycium ferocissimum TaxID=112874 RepID=UPI00281549B4|nr:growth-regulating factor 8-like isoform X1 [Lycium ferocissimum]